MKRITQKGWVLLDTDHVRWFPDRPETHYTFRQGAGEKPVTLDCEVAVCPAEISFTIPEDFDPRPEQVKQLEAQKRELEAKFSAAVNEINGRIASLQAITHEVEA